jgi:purine-binding chemotaxis protein CheW
MTSVVSEATVGRAEARAPAGKHLTFRLSDEEYGIAILKVREIIGITDITPVPQMPTHVRGVMNLRGKVIPVIDLRLKFGMTPAAYDEQTCIVVVDVGRLTGLIVDRVEEVLDIAADQIDAPPALGPGVDTRFIRGLGKVRGGVRILLDIDAVLADADLAAVASGPRE